MFDSNEITETTEIEDKPRRGRPPRVESKRTVELKKSAWIDGACIGNQGAELEVDDEMYQRLLKARVI